jgi:PAS domain S-box-containing protein
MPQLDRHALASSATAAINVGRVNGLIYAIVMESRGIYMSTDAVTLKRYADELVRRNHELAGVVAEWEKTVDFSDPEQFPAFKQRILQFVDFRNELVRRATKIDAAAGRERGDNDANRGLRTQLNVDLEAFARILDSRAMLVEELADQTRMASWYLALLGLAGSSLEEILKHRAENGLFSGDVKKYHAAIVERIIKRQPTRHEISFGDGRVVSIEERPMDGGGWIAMHEDVTEQRRGQRILERTEQFLATIIENIPEGIVAKDARSLRYVMVNRVAEKMIGMSRAEIMGKTAREVFPAAAADLIERRDRQLLEQEQQLDPIVDTVDNPVRGQRMIAVRRLQVAGPDHESHLFVSMFEDRTDQAKAADVAA